MKSEKRGQLTLAAVTLVICILCPCIFWLGSGSDAMGFALLVFYVILPVTALAASLAAGLRDYWGKLKWLLPLVFALVYIVTDYATFLVANNILTGKINPPRFDLCWLGAAASLAGLGLGCLIRWIKKK